MTAVLYNRNKNVLLSLIGRTNR